MRSPTLTPLPDFVTRDRRKPRSYQVTLDGLVSVGGGDTTLAGQPSGDIRNVGQPPPAESATAIGRRHLAEDDIEFRNAP